MRPCQLVLYPNSGSFGADIASAVPRVRSGLTVDISSHFDAVWLSSEKEIHRIV